MRFLLDWQHATADARMEGPDAVAAVISQLEGFEAAAAAWEAEILPARGERLRAILAGRPVPCRPCGLDAARSAEDCRRSRTRTEPVRSTPVTLIARRKPRAVDRAIPAGQR
jgi:ATP-dependent Lhr-like helicase